MAGRDIEVETRSFLSKAQYDRLYKFFRKNAKFFGTENQLTHYLNDKHDLRIMQSDSYSKIWMKKGKIHEQMREETELRLKREDFGKIRKIFSDLGFGTQAIWIRKRHSFLWKGLNVALDYTKGYGYILELEKMCTANDRKNALAEVNMRMRELGLEPASESEFREKYAYYRKNWRKLIGAKYGN